MKRMIVSALATALVVAACGGSDEAAEAPVTTTTTMATTTTTMATTTTTMATTTTEASPTTTTMATTTTTTEISTSPVVPGEDADADAIVALYAVVFDSSTTYEEKAPLIDDPAGLEGTVEAYTNIGESVGGLFLAVSEVGTDGDVAAVVYDLLFGGNPFQTDQPGDAVRNDGTWQVTRDFFCSVMERARVGCS